MRIVAAAALHSRAAYLCGVSWRHGPLPPQRLWQQAPVEPVPEGRTSRSETKLQPQASSTAPSFGSQTESLHLTPECMSVGLSSHCTTYRFVMYSTDCTLLTCTSVHTVGRGRCDCDANNRQL